MTRLARRLRLTPVVLLGIVILACSTVSPSTVSSTPSVREATTTSTGRPTSPGRAPRSATPSPTAIDSLPPFHLVARLDSPGFLESIIDLRPEADGALWLVTDLRVLTLRDGTWATYLSDLIGRMLGMDASHRVWVIAGRGDEISAWDGAHWSTYGPAAGWEPLPEGSSIYGGIVFDHRDQAWLATELDARVFDGERWTLYGLEEMGMPVPEFDEIEHGMQLFFLPVRGQVWAGSCFWAGPGPVGGGGVRWFDGESWRGADSPVASGCAMQVREDTAGNVWVGIDDALWRLDAGSQVWSSFPAPQPPTGNRFGFVTDLPIDRAGEPWPELAACGGASCYGDTVRYHVTSGDWVQVGAIGTLEDPSQLLFDATGQAWDFTPAGFYRVEGAGTEPTGQIFIEFVTQDPQGSIWFVWAQSGEKSIWVFPAGG